MLRAFFSGLPFQVGYFYNRGIQKMIDDAIKIHQPDLIYCQLIRTSEYVKNTNRIPKVLDYMDVYSKGIERRIKKAPFIFRPFFKMEYRRLLKYENHIFNYFDKKTIISEQDRNLIPHPLKNEIVVIPNGVDLDYFKPVETKKKYDLLLTGNMAYPPNIDSALFLVKEILPLLREKYPEVKLLLAGADPAKQLLNLQTDFIKVSGWMDDIRDSYLQSKVFIAPMRIGIGMQNKLLEAMAMKVPCITSPLAFKGLEAPADVMLVARDAREYANHIISLLENAEKARQLAEKAYAFVQTKHNWSQINLNLEKVFNEICSATQPR